MTDRPRGTAYLLSQVGTAAAQRFSERVSEQGFTPREAGVLRLLARSPGLSQRDLSARLGTAPSGTVVLIDGLEARGLVARVRGSADRRHYELQLTEVGKKALDTLRTISERHDDATLAGLTERQRTQLHTLLQVLSTSLELDPQVHPGYAAGRPPAAGPGSPRR